MSVDSGSTATSFKFDVTFSSPEAAITAAASDLPVTFSNSAASSQTAEASQVLTFDVTGTGAFDPPNPWVDPINGNDQITTTAGTPVTFTPQGESADGSTVQVGVQTMLSVPSVPDAYVDTSFLNTSTAQTNPAQNPNPNITVTQNGSSYTVTPAAGFYGVQVVEVTGLDAVSGTLQLQVGSTTTPTINFDSTNLAATATNIQNALDRGRFRRDHGDGRSIERRGDLQLRRDVRLKRGEHHLYPALDKSIAGHVRQYGHRPGSLADVDLHRHGPGLGRGLRCRPGLSRVRAGLRGPARAGAQHDYGQWPDGQRQHVEQ